MSTPIDAIVADGIRVHCAHTELVRTNELKPHPKNPNIHPKEQIEAFAKVVQVLGWRQAIVVSKRSGLITKGHGKLAVARYLDAKLVPVDYQDYKSEDEEWQDIIADNKIAEMSERDELAVASMLKELSERGANTTLTGYRDNEVERMLAKLTAGEPEPKSPDETEADELLRKWPVHLGDLFICGRHRILCGDSTNNMDWERLMEGNLAQVVHTDPPYGVDYQDRKGCEGAERNEAKVANDDAKGDVLAALIRKALKLCHRYTHPDAAFYIWHANRRDFEAALDASGLLERQYITWVKEMIVMGRADYQWQTEHCFYAEKAGHRAKWQGNRNTSSVWRIQKLVNDGTAIDLATGLHLSDGAAASLFLKTAPPKTGKFRHMRLGEDAVMIADRTATTAWQVSRDVRADYLHPTQKPAELAEIALTNSSAENDIVLDCFGGSFSTMVAAENLKRRAFVMDLEPKWCAVGIERWHRLTGAQPVKKS